MPDPESLATVSPDTSDLQGLRVIYESILPRLDCAVVQVGRISCEFYSEFAAFLVIERCRSPFPGPHGGLWVSNLRTDESLEALILALVGSSFGWRDVFATR